MWSRTNFLPYLYPPHQRSTLLSSALSVSSLPPLVRDGMLDAYATGTRIVYIAFTALGGLVFLSTLFIKVRLILHMSRGEWVTDVEDRMSNLGEIRQNWKLNERGQEG